MAKATKLPSGSWRCLGYFGGQRKSFTAASKKEAELMALEWQTGRKEVKNKGITVGEAAERYLSTRSAVLSPKTVKESKSIMKQIPLDVLNMYVSDIDRDAVQSWVNEMAKTKAPKTVKNRYGFLSTVIHSLEPDLRLKIILPQQVKNEIYIPTHEEVAHLLDILEGDMLTATLLASNMGLRRGELCALDNCKENFRKRKIDVHQAFVDDEYNRIVLKTTKTYDSNRILTAPQYIADHLLDIPKGWEYIVKSHPHNITQTFKRVVDREFDKSFTFHNLRHYYASVLVAEGVPERYAMYLLGHSTPNMIRKVYGHIMSDKEDEISTNINSFFSGKFAK